MSIPHGLLTLYISPTNDAPWTNMTRSMIDHPILTLSRIFRITFGPFQYAKLFLDVTVLFVALFEK